ncbi:MAG: chemotaxis protein CheA [Nitrospiraceae bacterium]|nr:chemotaxis protein CheA [Nitrospiraceae bacterium]
MEYSELLRDFLDDAETHLGLFDSALLSIEQNGFRKEVIMDMMGPLHTLKGNSGMMGFDSMKDYVHNIEEVLKGVAEEKVQIDRVMDALFDSVTAMREVLRSVAADPAGRPDLTAHILAIQECLRGEAGEGRRKDVDLFAYLGAKTDTIKVDFKRFDDLLNLVGELVINKTRLNQIGTRMRGTGGNKPLARELQEGLESMGKTIAELQEGIMRARMLPVLNVFGKYPRMVRDLSRTQGKEVELVFKGEETELDKTVIDELEEPLLHLIRNAVDHGMEDPKERVKRGKKRRGTITLSAGQESNYVIVGVSDDGRGIDMGRVKAAAVERGLLLPDETPDKETLKSLIFSAGLSTKDEATDLSGRGVGLDVVIRKIGKLGGQIAVDSTAGGGTVFTIKLPLSLAIIPALMVEAGEEVYAIPMSAVDESIKVKGEDIHMINNHEVVEFRDKVVPVVRLGDFFHIGCRRRETFYLIVLSRAEKKLAVAVDRLRGRQEIVIKPLDETFGKSYGVAGASILGDGRIVLIADVTAFWRETIDRTNGGPAGVGCPPVDRAFDCGEEGV